MLKADYLIKKRSIVGILKDGVLYPFNSASSVGYTQTLKEKTISRKNQFNLKYPDIVVNRGYNTGSGSLEVFLDLSCDALPILLKHFGIEKDLEYNYNILTDIKETPLLDFVVYDLYSNKALKLGGVIVTSLDFGFAPKSLNRLAFSLSFSSLEEIPYRSFSINGLKTPQYLKPEYINCILGAKSLPNIRSAGFTITKKVEWLSEGSNQFNTGQLGIPNTPIITGIDCSANIILNNRFDSIDINTVSDLDIFISNGSVSLSIPKSRVTKRISEGEISQLSYDVKHSNIEPIKISINK